MHAFWRLGRDSIDIVKNVAQNWPLWRFKQFQPSNICSFKESSKIAQKRSKELPEKCPKSKMSIELPPCAEPFAPAAACLLQVGGKWEQEIGEGFHNFARFNLQLNVNIYFFTSAGASTTDLLCRLPFLPLAPSFDSSCPLLPSAA